MFVLEIFDWTYFTAKIMDTVNISVPDTEKVINYSPNYYRRLGLVLNRYTQRSVRICLIPAPPTLHAQLILNVSQRKEQTRNKKITIELSNKRMTQQSDLSYI